MSIRIPTGWSKNIPNQLTLMRIAAVPILLVLYPLDMENVKVFCGLLFMLAAMTDFADGFIARRFNAESQIGAILDPIADKLLTAVALLLLASNGAMWTWMAGLLLAREIAMNGLRLVARDQNVDIPVSSLGKWKTLFLDVSITCLLVDKQLFGWPFHEVGMTAAWLSFFLSYYSAYLYFSNFWKNSNL